MPAMIHASVVAKVLGQLHDLSDPEREDGTTPRTKAGWIRLVLAAAKRAGYQLTPIQQIMKGPLFLIRTPPTESSPKGAPIGVMRVQTTPVADDAAFVTTIVVKSDYEHVVAFLDHVDAFIDRHPAKASYATQHRRAPNDSTIRIVVRDMQQSENLFNDILFRGGFPTGYSATLPSDSELMAAFVSLG